MKTGDKVTYTPTNEIGIVKSLTTGPGMGVYVVFNCGDDWDNYQNYTAALCDPSNLKTGWDQEAFMDHYGLGPEDMINDITYPNG